MQQMEIQYPYPCHDNRHFHIERLLHKQLIVTWLVEEAGQPSFIPDPANYIITTERGN